MQKYYIFFFIIIGAALLINKTNAQCYMQKSTSGLPPFTWMLTGNKSDYQSYNTNEYFIFNSNWSHGQCGGANKRHTGWDIHKPGQAAIAGTNVYAVCKGTVKAVFNAGTGWASGITIEHTDNNSQKFTTTYMHVNPAEGITENTSVSAGQWIAVVADLAQYDHLHFSVRRAAYSNTANRGALPKDLNNNSCVCSGDPVFPEHFVDPGTITYTNPVPATSSNPPVGTYVACPSSINGSCGNATGNTVRMKVNFLNYGAASFTVAKCSGNFTQNGVFYIKEAGLCGQIINTPQQFAKGSNSVTVNCNVVKGRTYHGLIISSDNTRFYAGKISF